ncbi:hypothetical protein NKR23_g3761 [Pleurostoma richardsiae]|uniref:Uncharacterized protein n=1 Tax=Pleurostoma richardsiae TaxID=41990 RepID=A0AA38VGR9_9PEZI|nr:hypothetical protein NKR23_g3761 [Pleurostoma richardsiae]
MRSLSTTPKPPSSSSSSRAPRLPVVKAPGRTASEGGNSLSVNSSNNNNSISNIGNNPSIRKKPSITFTRTTVNAKGASAATNPRTPRLAAPGRHPSSSRDPDPATPPALASTSTSSSLATPTFTTAPPIPTAASAITRRSRPPLVARDGNVPLTTMRNLTTGLRTSREATTPTMAPDKSRQPAPQMPTLAKGLSRASTPLTPKVAAAATRSPNPQTVTVATTPIPRRVAARPESSAGSNGQQQHGTGGSHQRDDYASPISAFLSSNITPRSGSRQSRVDSANSTPNSTPNPERSSDVYETRSGLGISGGPSTMGSGDAGFRSRQSVSFSPPASDRRQEQQQQQSSNDSKFFYASDAKSHHSSSSLAQPKPQPKAPTFFYANGDNIPSRPATATSTPFTPVLSPHAQPDSISSKFIYANGIPDMQPPLKSPSASGSVVSSVSKMGGSRGSGGTQSPAYGVQRPPSPMKMPSYPTPKSNECTPALALNPAGFPSTPQLGPTASFSLQRSSTSGPVRGHARGNSLTIADPPAVARVLASSTSSEASSPAGVQPTPAFTMASILQAAEDFASDDQHHDDGSSSADALASPTKSTFGSDPLNELVATARRDRKVQDLEIRNASLEAINRTIERQLRKQTAELRRYRRLSRSGRLSLASGAGSMRKSNRIASDSTLGDVPLVIPDLDLSDLSEEDDDSYLEDEYDDDMSSSPSESEESSALSPTTAAARDARHRQRDERRLRLDLSKHQQLLVDSQKINQSLKRCLGWTEELIRDGRRALEYQVRVSEVEIGGRVLAPPDEEDDDDGDDESAGGDSRRSERGEDDTVRIEVQDSPVEEGSSVLWSKDPQDRDSGIELPGDGG